jgi:hypothetical protein
MMTREVDVLRLLVLAMAALERGNLHSANQLLALAIEFSRATSAPPMDRQQRQRQPKGPRNLRAKK